MSRESVAIGVAAHGLGPRTRPLLRGPRPEARGLLWRKFVAIGPVPAAVLRASQQFDEIRVFEGVAERTGTTVDRKTVRGSAAACRSLSELARLVRRLGDGVFYLPVSMWPEGVTQLPLSETWTPMS